MRSRWAMLMSGSTLLASCSLMQPAPEPVTYACDGGKEFRMTFLPDDQGAEVEFSRMHFHLRREKTGSGMRYACDVLTFTGQGESASLDIQGDPSWQNCRVKKASAQ